MTDRNTTISTKQKFKATLQSQLKWYKKQLIGSQPLVDAHRFLWMVFFVVRRVMGILVLLSHLGISEFWSIYFFTSKWTNFPIYNFKSRIQMGMFFL